MKRQNMLIFFLIVFAIYFLVNFYIFIKGYRIIPQGNYYKLIYSVAFILLAATFIAGKILERNSSTIFSDILNIIGGFWMAFMLYGFLFLLLADIARPVLRLTGVITAQNILLFKKWAFIATVVVSAILITVGFINALIPVVRTYNITINKSAGELKTFRIAAVSDIHLGSIIRKRSIMKLSELLEKSDPDIVFLLGDIVDGEMGPVLRDDLLSYFTPPKSRDGLLAITGNHEYIGGAAVTIPYIEKHGIRILKDEVVTIEGEIQIVGRLDRGMSSFENHHRMPLDSLMKKVDRTKPVILLDHQPLNLSETEKEGVDLQLSGHTHNGQMWPLNYITRMIYEVSSGYKRKGNTQIIVSSGYGIWGPRVRLGSRSEVLVINITFAATKGGS
jgi:predicted MPP superfamily phosphohydrolase